MCKLYFSRKEVELKKDNMLINSSKVAFVYLDSYKAMNASFIKKKKKWYVKKKLGRSGRASLHSIWDLKLLNQG